MAEACEESAPDSVFDATVKGLAAANRDGTLSGITSLNVAMNENGVVSATMDMAADNGLSNGKKFYFQLSPTKAESRPTLPATADDNRLLLLDAIFVCLPGTTFHLPPHNAPDAFASVVLDDGTTYIASAWYTHDADAARAMRKNAKEEELALRAEEAERLQKQRLECKAKERERERLKSFVEKAESDRRRQEVRDAEAEKALQAAQALGFKTVEDMTAALLKKKQAADAAEKKKRDEERKLANDKAAAEAVAAAEAKRKSRAEKDAKALEEFRAKNVKGTSSGSSSNASSRERTPPPSSGGGGG